MKTRIKIITGIVIMTIATAIGIGGIISNAASANEEYTFYSDFGMTSMWSFIRAEWERQARNEREWSSWFKPKNVKFDDNKMLLTVDRNESGLTGGQVYTSQTYGYGLYQVNMQPIKNSGVVSAFFNYYQEGETGTEIDIEFLGYDTTKVQFNYYTNGVGEHEYLYDLGFDASEGLHTYAFYWASDAIIWYVDGVQAYKADINIPQHEARIHMDVCAGDNPDWVGAYDGTAPLTAYYDWISYTRIENMN